MRVIGNVMKNYVISSWCVFQPVNAAPSVKIFKTSPALTHNVKLPSLYYISLQKNCVCMFVGSLGWEGSMRPSQKITSNVGKVAFYVHNAHTHYKSTIVT